MADLFKKALWLLRRRPGLFIATLGQYWRFKRTRWLAKLFLSSSSGVRLAPTARLQRLACLSAERPSARIEVGEDAIIYEKAQVGAFGAGRIEIGEACILGEAKIFARESIKLGKHVVTSWNVFIQDFDPHPVDPELRRVQMMQMCEGFRPRYRAAKAIPKLDWNFETAAIEIGDNVWLGANVTVLKGARIGADSVVATGAVVTAGTYPPRSILAGMPAKVVKTLPAGQPQRSGSP